MEKYPRRAARSIQSAVMKTVSLRRVVPVLVSDEAFAELRGQGRRAVEIGADVQRGSHDLTPQITLRVRRKGELVGRHPIDWPLSFRASLNVARVTGEDLHGDQ